MFWNTAVKMYQWNFMQLHISALAISVLVVRKAVHESKVQSVPDQINSECFITPSLSWSSCPRLGSTIFLTIRLSRNLTSPECGGSDYCFRTLLLSVSLVRNNDNRKSRVCKLHATSIISFQITNEITWLLSSLTFYDMNLVALACVTAKWEHYTGGQQPWSWNLQWERFSRSGVIRSQVRPNCHLPLKRSANRDSNIWFI